MNLRRPNLLRFLIFLSVIHSNDAQNDFTSKLDKLFKQISQQPEVKGISNILRPKFTDSERIDLVFNNQSTITCQKQWDLILSYQKWQITKFWDSWSHVWTGQLEGNINFLGQSEECLNVKNGVMPVTLENFPDTKPFLIFYKQDPTDSFEYNIVICMPAVCPKQEVAKLFKEYKNPDENQPPFVSGASSQADIQITAGAVIAWVVFGIIGVLIVQGTSIGIQRQLLGESIRSLTNPGFPPIQKQVNHTLPSHSQYDSRLIILWTIKVYGSRLTILWTYMVQSMILHVP